MMRAAVVRPALNLVRRLWRDESGVVLGVTMVMLMALYAMATALFVLGERIRERIELQNAVDAAAYSAAVVQADTISRIAAINQAMAWIYVQMCRRHMDLMLYMWLKHVELKFLDDSNYLHGIYNSWHWRCSKCGQKERVWGIGYPGSDWKADNKRILFNGYYVQTIGEVQAVLAAVNHKALESGIDTDEKVLQSMAQAEKELIANLRPRVVEAAEEVLRRNGVSRADDWLTVITGDAQNYFHVYGGSNESRDGSKGEPEFLRTLGDGVDGADVLGAGAEDGGWFALRGAPQPWRRYVQQADALKAEWYGRVEGYASKKKVKYCRNRHGANWSGDERNRLNGQAVKGSEVGFRPVMPVEPHRLSCRYFDGDVSCNGGIVVAVARRIGNPFAVLMAGGGGGGFYDVIGDGGGRLMLAAAAARAGYHDVGRPAPDGGSDGVYSPYSDSYEIVWHTNAKDEADAKDKWQDRGWAGMSNRNLGLVDWDAVLVPLGRVWSRRRNAWQYRSEVAAYGGGSQLEPGSWVNDAGDAAEVLEHLREHAEWKSPVSGQRQHGLAGLGIVQGTTTNRFGTTPEELARSLWH